MIENITVIRHPTILTTWANSIICSKYDSFILMHMPFIHITIYFVYSSPLCGATCDSSIRPILRTSAIIVKFDVQIISPLTILRLWRYDPLLKILCYIYYVRTKNLFRALVVEEIMLHYYVLSIFQFNN